MSDVPPKDRSKPPPKSPWATVTWFITTTRPTPGLLSRFGAYELAVFLHLRRYGRLGFIGRPVTRSSLVQKAR